MKDKTRAVDTDWETMSRQHEPKRAMPTSRHVVNKLLRQIAMRTANTLLQDGNGVRTTPQLQDHSAHVYRNQ